MIRILFALLTAGAGPAPPKVWLGTFERESRIGIAACTTCTKPMISGERGSVVVLTPSDGSALPTGEVLVVSPLLGVISRGRIEGGRIAVPWFNFDHREGSSGVLVLPGAENPRFVAPAAGDVIAIKQTLLRNEVLSYVKRSVNGIEVGAIDLDGNGTADLVVTYGCNTWGDGQCQSRGQFFVARRGAKWVEID